jgi:hypothetical protein
MSDLDELMRRIEDINAKPAIDLTSSDIDDIIKYHRHSRARKAKGEKPSKPQSIDISQVMMKLTKPKTEVKVDRRF